MALSDYGAEYILRKTFENTDVFEVALFTAGSPDDTPELEEVALADYTRLLISGTTGGSIDYQTVAGAVSVIDTGIAAYTFIYDTTLHFLEFEFPGALTGNPNVIGYAILKPGTWANPFVPSAVLDSGLFEVPFTPTNPGDKLIINSISVRLSKGTVS